MISFIHTADIHFGMENYGRIDPATGIHSRLLDFERALNFCIDVALEKKVDFFLFAGDAYKTVNPSPTQQRLLLRCFLRLHQAGIPIVCVVGNHDNPLSFGKATTLDIFGQLPVDGFHVLAKPGILQLRTKAGPINIVGIPWPSRTNIAVREEHTELAGHELAAHIAQLVTHLIHEYAAQLDPNIPAVLAGHLTVSTGIFSGSEKRAIVGSDPIFLPSALAIAPFDYVALGHLHRHQNLNSDGYPPVVYSGSIERVDFGERKEPKGFCYVQIAEKGRACYEFIETPTRPFIQIEVKLTKEAGTQTQQLVAAIQQHAIENAIVKIIYYVPAGELDTVDTHEVLRACSAAMHVVSIVPIREISVRERRHGAYLQKDLPSLLKLFLDQKGLAADPERRQALIAQAIAVAEQIREQETVSETAIPYTQRVTEGER
jgi:exonuclease SbcD